MALSTIGWSLKFAILWAFSSPFDAWRAGGDSWSLSIARLFGQSPLLFVARLLWGPFKAGFNYGASMEDVEFRLD